MTLVKKMKLFHLLIFGEKKKQKQKQPAKINVFDDILERKKAFLESKIRKLKKSKNQDFSKRVSLWLWSKI